MQLSTRFFALASCVLSVLAQNTPPQALNQTITTLTTQARTWGATIDSLQATNTPTVGPKVIQNCADIVGTIGEEVKLQHSGPAPRYSETDSRALVTNLKVDHIATAGALTKLRGKRDVIGYDLNLVQSIHSCLNSLDQGYATLFHSTISSLTGPAVADAQTVEFQLDQSIKVTISAYNSLP